MDEEVVNIIIADKDNDKLFSIDSVTVEPDGNGGEIIFVWIGSEI